MLTANAILSAEDRKPVKVEVKEWGGAVYLREMSGADAEQWYQQAIDDKSAQNRVASYLVRCLCDKDGNLLFTQEQSADLAQKSQSVLQRLFREAQVINGLDREGKA